MFVRCSWVAVAPRCPLAVWVTRPLFFRCYPRCFFVVIPAVLVAFNICVVRLCSACVVVWLSACCPPVNGRLRRCVVSLFLLCFSFVFGNDPTTKRHPIPPVFNCCPALRFPHVGRTFNRRFSVGFPLLYRCLNVQATPLYCGFDRSPFSGCCFVVLSSFPQALPIARRYPILTPKNSRSTPRHEIRVITRIARCAIV